jgi:hypothetical protein
MAERLATHIRGADVISDSRRLEYVASQFGDPVLLDPVLTALQEIGWVSVRGSGDARIVEESVPYFADIYEAVGKYYVDRGGTEVEDAVILAADALAAAPAPEEMLAKELGGDETVYGLAKDVGRAGGLIDEYVTPAGETILYSPPFWTENPEQFDALYALIGRYGLDVVAKVFDDFRSYQGKPLPSSLFSSSRQTTEQTSLLRQLVRAGVLLAPQVNSTSGIRYFGFTPHAGIIPEDKMILEKAMAVLSCVRYGEHFGAITKIKFPDTILSRLVSSPHRIGPHTEIRNQYALLVTQGIGRLSESKREKGRYYFQLIDIEENLRAVELARDLLLAGEAVATKKLDEKAQQALFQAGSYEESLRAVPKVKRPLGISRGGQEAVQSLILGLAEEIRKA